MKSFLFKNPSSHSELFFRLLEDHWLVEKMAVIRNAAKEAGYEYYFAPRKDIFSYTEKLLAQEWIKF